MDKQKFNYICSVCHHRVRPEESLHPTERDRKVIAFPYTAVQHWVTDPDRKGRTRAVYAQRGNKEPCAGSSRGVMRVMRNTEADRAFVEEARRTLALRGHPRPLSPFAHVTADNAPQDF